MLRLFTLIFSLCIVTSLKGQQLNMTDEIESQKSTYGKIALKIWEWAEVGYQEEKSSTLLKKTLSDAGFSIQTGVAEIPTAFIAEYGSGQPVIAILAEYDALPGVSQKAVPTRDPVITGGAGHACGHHLFGTASVAAGIAVKNWLITNKIKGTLDP